MKKRELTKEENQRLIEAASIDHHRFDDMAFEMIGRQLADALPFWALHLILRLTTKSQRFAVALHAVSKWLMKFQGVYAFQSNANHSWQYITIVGRDFRFTLDGRVSDRLV